jgi:outer membrane protein OmpA-like peptidoglycan-associated protein
MKTIIRLSLFILVSAAGIACVGAKKMEAARERLNNIKEGQAGEVKQVEKISSATRDKRKEDKIDSIINSRFDFSIRRITIRIDSIAAELFNLDSLMGSKKQFRRAYKKIIMPKLAQLDSFRLQFALRNQAYLMMEDGINTANYTLFDLAAFFGSGKYAIPEGQEETAVKAFSPLVDSVVQFSAKYKNMPQKATLVILGFADGTGFDPQSPLYTELAGLIGKSEVSKQELNKKLSELRAKTLINQLQKQFIQKLDKNGGAGNIKIEFLEVGKGEQYPFLTVKDYREDDERRRIVLCYWAVLPD